MTTEKLGRFLAPCVLGAALCAAALPASAQGYAGASIGMTTVDFCNDLAGLGLTGCDDDDTGYKFFGGFHVNQNLAVEVAWVDLGQVKASGPGGTARVGIDGIQLAALGIAPLGPQFRLFGKLGFYLWDGSVSGPGTVIKDDGTDIMFGLGGAWAMSRQVDLRLEWERFDVDGDDVDMFSVGLQFRF